MHCGNDCLAVESLPGPNRSSRIDSVLSQPYVPESGTGSACANLRSVFTQKPEASMPFRVSGKNIELGEALRERISARVLEALEKYFDGGFSGHVTVGKEAFGFQTECTVHLDSGMMLRSDSMAADAYLSADQAAENLEKRLRRYHRRLKDYKGAGRNNGHPVGDAGGIAVPDYGIAAPGDE